MSVEATHQYFATKAAEFLELCGRSTNAFGTPMLYINDPSVPLENRCLVGDTDIIAYFRTKLNEEEIVLATDGVNEIVEVDLDSDAR